MVRLLDTSMVRLVTTPPTASVTMNDGMRSQVCRMPLRAPAVIPARRPMAKAQGPKPGSNKATTTLAIDATACDDRSMPPISNTKVIPVAMMNSVAVSASKPNNAPGWMKPGSYPAISATSTTKASKGA
ncbi:hypothetical protein D3C78_1215140 [compost metagenome]